MDEDHITVSDDPEFEVEVHPGFASECTIDVNGQTRQLYKQQGVHKLKNGKHPTRHRIRLREKGRSGRELTFTIEDPTHRVAKVRIDLYESERDASTDTEPRIGSTFTVMNWGKTCPPHCGSE